MELIFGEATPFLSDRSQNLAETALTDHLPRLALKCISPAFPGCLRAAPLRLSVCVSQPFVLYATFYHKRFHLSICKYRQFQRKSFPRLSTFIIFWRCDQSPIFVRGAFSALNAPSRTFITSRVSFALKLTVPSSKNLRMSATRSLK